MKVALALVALVGVLAGCSDSSTADGPATLPPVSAAPSSPSPPSPSAGAPVVAVSKPTLADEASAAGAEAFARYWLDTINVAYKTRDASTLRSISDSGCATCQAYIGSFERAAAHGTRYEGGEFVVRLVVVAPEVGDTATVLLNYDVPPLLVYDSTGALSTTVEGAVNSPLQFELQRRASSWVAMQVAQL